MQCAVRRMIVRRSSGEVVRRALAQPKTLTFPSPTCVRIQMPDGSEEEMHFCDKEAVRLLKEAKNAKV